MRYRQAGVKAIFLAGAASGSLFWQPAVAQTNGQQVAQASGGEQIEEVIVTARKREENIQTIPLAVSAVSGEALQQHQITDSFGLQRLTPGLQAESQHSPTPVPAFAIRGIGTNVFFGPQVESSVGVVVDDVPLARMEFGNIQFFDIDNVEVLKGPQGMLFGKNADAGLINIVTNNPELGETDLFGHVQYGNMNTPTAGNSATVNLGANVPTGENSALRVAGFLTHTDGFIKDVLEPNQDFGQTQGGVRAKFLWEPTSRLKVLAAGDYSLLNGPGSFQGAYRYTTGNPPFPSVAGAYNAVYGVAAGPRNDLVISGGPYNYLHSEVFGASLKVEYDLDGGYTLTNIVGYRGYGLKQGNDDDELGGANIDFTPIPVVGPIIGPTSPNFLGDNRSKDIYNQTTEELRLTSPADQRLTWQGGIFFMHVKAEADAANGGLAGLPLDYTGTAPCALALPPTCTLNSLTVLNQFVHQSSMAGFFEGQFKILDSLRLTAGVRYTHDTINELATGGPTAFMANPTAHDISLFATTENSYASSEKDNWSYRTSLDYDITDDAMVYIGTGRGYKGPTFNAAVPNGGVAVVNGIPAASESILPVNDEVPYDYEAGLKSTWFDRRLRFNLALFHEIFFGYQAQAIESVPPFFAGTLNAGKLRSKGVELDATAIPLDGLTVNGAMTYNHTEFDGINVGCYVGEPAAPNPAHPGPNQCTSPLWVLGSSNATGNPLPQAPEWTETVTVRYEEPVWAGWEGFVQGDGYFRSPFNFLINADPHTEIGASAILGLSIGAQREDGSVSATLFVRNLTDKRVPSYVFLNGVGELANFPFGEADYVQQFNADSFRTIGVSVDFHT